MTSDERLKPCPFCGSKAFISHDFVDGYEFGWSVGCPRARISDGIHGFNDEVSFKNARLVMFALSSKDKAIEAWNRRVDGK